MAEDEGGVHGAGAVDVLATADVPEHASTGSRAPAAELPSHVVCRRGAHVWGTTVMVGVGVLTAAERSHDHVLDVVVYREVDGWLLHLDLLLGAASVAADRGLAVGLMRRPSLPRHEAADVRSVMVRVLVQVAPARCPLAVELVMRPTVSLARIRGVVALWVRPTCTGATGRRASRLLGVGSVLARPQAPIRTWSSALGPCNKRPVHPDELVDEVVDPLLVWAMASVGSLASIEVLREDLLQVPVELLCALILRKVLLVVLDELLNLVLELLLSHLPGEVRIEVSPTGAEERPCTWSAWLAAVARSAASMASAVRLLMSRCGVGLLVQAVGSGSGGVPHGAPEVVAVRVVGSVLLVLAVVNLLLAVVSGYLPVAVVSCSYWLLDDASAVASRTRSWAGDVVLGQRLLVMAAVLDRLVLARVH